LIPKSSFDETDAVVAQDAVRHGLKTPADESYIEIDKGLILFARRA
jgi:hypothetical protein